MKFLCVKCNEPMQFEEATGPEEGSLSITFGCPTCGNCTALLTNPGETQLVRSLNVHIGKGQRVAPEPMELVRETLARQSDQTFTQPPRAAQPEKTLIWTEEAEKRLENVPVFVRSMARKSIERYAMEAGYEAISLDVMAEARDKRGG